jgi:hypothetical protein
MKAYLDYKEWWIGNVFPSERCSLYYGEDPEKAFKQHVKDLSLYGLMEKLCEWSDE